MPEMSKIAMGPEAETAIKQYVRNKLDWLKQCHKDFHENHLPRWRKFYDAIPRERYKSFPWPMACLTRDTDVLTDSGWKGVAEVTTNDQVYSMDWDGNADFYPVKAAYRYECKDLVRFSGKSVDLAVTRNHNMLVQSAPGGGSKRKFVWAEYFLEHGTTGYDFPLTSKRRGKGLDEVFGLPVKAYLRFLGWYISEGSYVKEKPGTLHIAQKPGKKRDILKADVEACGFKYGENYHELTIHIESMPRAMVEQMYSLGGCGEKHIPRGVLRDCSAESLKDLLATLVLGDGTVSKKNGAMSYATTSKQLADNVQELCQYIGLRGTISHYGPVVGGTIKGRQIKGTRRVYVVAINRKPLIQVAKLKRWLEEKPQGVEVFCVNTEPHHTIYVRRNGKACWTGNSNLVVPVVAIHTDTLHARVMAAVFRTIPLWVCQTVGEHDGIEELRQAQEAFMNYVGIEPRQLDLYRVYNEFYKETIKIGTSVLKAPWTKRVESQIAASGPYTDIELQNIVVQEGPRPEKLAIEDFMVAPQTKQEDQADFISHRIRMMKEDLEQRRFLGIYSQEAVDKVLIHPTRSSPSTVQQQKEERQGLPKTAQGFGYAEWDIYECHFLYHIRTGGYGYQTTEEAAKEKTTPAGFYRCIVTYHYETDTMLRAVYNFYPENTHPFVAGRLILRDDAFYAKGFAEGLEMMQEEASTIHNQGLDNATMANMRFFTIRNNPKLNDSLRIYPGAMIPVSSQEDLQERQLGDIYPSNFQAQAGTMDIAERWTGISPPMQGYGAGVMQGKRGVYTALGTMSMLQEGNRRSDLAISDLRYPHILLGRKVRAMYAKWGVPQSVIEAFGKLGPALKKSMTLEATKKLDILIHSATASINREVERQNLLMLTNQLGTFYQQMSQVVVAMLNPQINPAQRDYITQVMECATNLENRLMKAFEYDDISRYVPKTSAAIAAAQALNQPQPQPEAPPGEPGGNPQVSAGPGGGSIPGSSPGTPAGMGGNPRQPFYQSFGRSTVPGSPSSGGPQ